MYNMCSYPTISLRNVRLSHEVSTFLGVRHMVFDLSDFSGAEREEVRRVEPRKVCVEKCWKLLKFLKAWDQSGGSVFVGFFNFWECGKW